VGEEQQDKYAAALDKGFSLLQDNPEIGRGRLELYRGCRSYRIREHIEYYAVSGEEIKVSRVLHVRMDAKRYL